MPSRHLILCCPLLLLPLVPPSIRVFPSESTLGWKFSRLSSSGFFLLNNCFSSPLFLCVFLQAVRRNQTTPSVLYLEIWVAKCLISSLGGLSSTKHWRQVSQVLGRIKTGVMPFLWFPLTCSSFLSEASPESPLNIHISRRHLKTLVSIDYPVPKSVPHF